MRALQANIRNLLVTKGWTQEQLAEEIGTSQPTINRWLKEVNFPRQNQINNLAALAGVSEGEFVYGSGRFVKLVDWVAASQFTETTDPYDISDPNAPTVLTAGLSHDDYIALTVRGESMNKIAPNGSVIFVDLRQKDLLPNRYYVIRSNDEATFKKYESEPVPLFVPYSSGDFPKIQPGPGHEIVGRVVRVSVDLS